MRPALLLASLALPPLLALPGHAQESPAPATAAAVPSVRIRTGQHADHGRVVLHLGRIPSYALQRVGKDWELRLRGPYRLDFSEMRRIAELADSEARQENGETVLRLHPACDCVAEAGAFDGMLYVDLRPAASEAPRDAPREVHSPAQLAAARRRLLDDAVKLGLMSRPQAIALLRGTAPAAMPAAAPAPTAGVAQPAPAPASAAPVPAAVPAPTSTPAPESPTPAQATTLQAAAASDDMAALREGIVRRLAVLNGTPTSTTAAPEARPEPAPAASVPAPNPRFVPPAQEIARPACLEASFTLQGWAGPEAFPEQLAKLRAALAHSDQGAAEIAALAEFYTGHELTREALNVLSTPLAEQPAGETLERLQRARDVARLLARQPIDPASPLLAEAADCTWPDLPLWRGLNAALHGEATVLARLAPAIRTALREVPQDLRIAFVGILTDAVEEDAETLRTLVGAIRTAGDLHPDQTALRSWLLARLARLEGNRADEMLHLQKAAQTGRWVPALQARARLAALNLNRPGLEGQRAEQQLLDFSRTYRFDALGEEAATLYAQRLLERGDLAGALAVADGASQASLRPSMESRGARLAAQAMRLLLVDAKGMTLPPPDERLALYWQYEGYATPGERGDDIRRGALRLMLDQGLADAALDTARQLTPATRQQPETALLVARAEASAAQGDVQRALALLRGLPPSPEVQRTASAALARLGKPQEAADELAGLTALEDRQTRAGLLFQAKAWPEAATAYADLLRDPALEPAARAEATTRLASAAALARQRPAVPAELLAPRNGAAALLQLSGDPAGAPVNGVAAVRSAIARSREIEKLLPGTGNN
ncbi:MAG TPA: hypothetical protein VNZ61_26270 [Roseomonas sp.]|nr:hypothetical protein [Roseomonas sp.]